ncbi:hypothetical protein BHE90_004182 [Fusarium euwallaceae]|uniref:Zn(2)-C6 fungal-type domain-containing protein n=1 Tax=Fusarium euwallaceae TaxID=1147111 RepID=A0A430LZZ2_9HYPO|nr:hypothetical protein BHE90_004182 [Fusarium euwallaceae]
MVKINQSVTSPHFVEFIPFYAAMSFARRRAPIACLFCRHRKRRCDGVKPICGLCAASGVDCEYSDKMSDIQKARQENASNEVLVQRINDLENMLRNQ